MGKIDIDIFTSVQDDLEKRQYHILAYLQNCLHKFKRNRLYPELGQLSRLHDNLITLKNSFEGMKSEFPKRITGMNLEEKTLDYEITAPGSGNLRSVEDLIEWALPKIQSVSEEGVSIFEFINENLELEKVGMEPRYLNEGYFMIPDNFKRNIRLYQFEISLFTASKEKYRTLKTKFLKTLVHNYAEKPPTDIKLDLIKQYSDLPNPATYACQTDLDFPFPESIFPVARRKLMMQFYQNP